MDLAEIGMARGEGGGGMAWITVPRDRDNWWAVVNTAMNVRVA